MSKLDLNNGECEKKYGKLIIYRKHQWIKSFLPTGGFYETCQVCGCVYVQCPELRKFDKNEQNA